MKQYIGEIVKKQRMNKKISQEELAEKVGVTRKTIYQWEKGEQEITITHADKLCKALGIKITLGKC